MMDDKPTDLLGWSRSVDEAIKRSTEVMALVDIPDEDEPQETILPQPELQNILPDKGWLRDYFDVVSPATDTPQIFHVTAGLATEATACGNRVWLPDVAGKQFLNLYIVNLGPSGASRKSTGNRPAFEIFRRSDSWGLDFLLSSDFSIEALGREFQQNPERLICASEFKATIDVFKRGYNQEGISKLVCLFDHGFWDIVRMGEKKAIVSDIALTILGASTTEWLLAALEPSGYQAGLWVRFLFCLGQRERFLPDPGYIGDRIDTLRSSLVAIRDGVEKDTRADFSLVQKDIESFAITSERLREQLGRDPKGSLLEGAVSRLPLYAKKIACLMAISQTGVPAPMPEDFERARNLVTFLFDCHRYIVEMELAFSDVERKRRDLLRVILNRPGIVKSDLTRKTQNLSKRERDQLLEELTEGRWIRSEEQETTRKPVEVFYPYSYATKRE